MNHPLFTWRKFQECPKLLNAYDLPDKNLSCLKIRGDDSYQPGCLVHHFLICPADRYRALIVNVNLHTGQLYDGINSLASLTYHIANLRRIDLNLYNLRRKLPDFFPRFRDCFRHYLIHNVKPCFPGSADSFLHNRPRQAMNLDVHLDSRNAVMRTCHLKVHVAEKVFQPLDVCQHEVIIIRIPGHQAAGNSGNHLLNRYARSHQRHTRCTCGCHGCRAVGLKCLRYGADCIGKFLLGRKHRQQRALCQGSVPYLTPSRAPAGLCLSHRIRREVIMVHITFIYFILI